MPIRRLAAVAAVSFAVVATPALAQTVDEQLAALVTNWAMLEARGVAPEVQAYGIACATPVVLAMPDTMKQRFIAIGAIRPVLDDLELTDLRAYDRINAPFQQCVETMLVGGAIWAWVQAEEAAAGYDAQRAAAFCVMDAINPLSGNAKAFLFQSAIAPGADFEDALDALVTADPTLEAPLQAGIEPCL